MEDQSIFVYGSLRRGYGNHYFLRNAVFIDYDSITAVNISCSFFYGIIEGDDVVQGEVYLCNAETMARVDILEGIEWGAYLKREVTTHKGNKCFAYFINLDPSFIEA